MNRLAIKAISAARFFADPETWRVAASDRGRSRSVEAPRPEIRVIEDDPAAGLRLVEAGGFRSWQPREGDLAMLAEIHAEVFDPSHPHHYEHLGCRVRPGDVVVDAGACEGFFTRFALDRGARVIAVEPWSVQAGALRRTFAREIEAGSVRVEQVALADRPGEVTLSVDPHNPWGATVGVAYAATASEVVPSRTLDDLIAATWGRADFLKADVEGAEIALVGGMAATLARDRPRLSIAVYHRANNYLDIRRVLRGKGLGYRVVGKGIRRRGIAPIPMVLHAWTGPDDGH